jgi:hypothetical protein
LPQANPAEMMSDGLEESMIPLLVAIALVVNLGPIGPDAPAHEPHLATSGSTVALTFGAGTGIYFSSSSDAGKTFSSPVKVAQADIVPLTRHRGPRIAITNHAIVITAVMGRTAEGGPHAHGLPSDGDLIAWRSADGGKTWSKGVLINDVPGAPTEGLHSLAADTKGTLFAAWLDKRSGHGTKLYGARSADGGLTWSKNVMIYDSPEGTICECCHPSVALDAAGQVLVMWRNWLAGSRDMYLTRSRDGVTFSKPEKMGTGTWQLNACPMDGGGLVVSQNHVVSAWRREHEIFLAAPGEKEVGIGEGIDVTIAGAPEGVYAVWSTPAGIRALLPGKKESIALAPKGAFPNVAALPNDRALAAWEVDGAIQIQPVQ